MRSEIEALRSVSHPNLIRVLDSNLEDRWFVMEYFPRGTLAEHLGMFKGNFLSALTHFRPLVEAVAELHRSSFVHRDIKPENIFMSDRGLVVGDLGLVYFQDQNRTRATDTFENVGSRDWMPGWAMGMRIDQVRPSFDVFSLGKVLWSMISGQPRLQLWYHHRDRFELEKMFPASPDIRWARTILDKCIVEEEKDCLANAQELLSLVEKVFPAVERHAQIVSERVPRVCIVCGLGEYHEMSKDTLMLAQTFRIFMCRHCGHSEFFYAAGGVQLPAWGSGGQVPQNPSSEAETKQSNPFELRERLQAVDLSVHLVSANPSNFILNITNHSDEDLRVTRIRLESRGVELSNPAEPAPGIQWKIQKRGTTPLGWRADPDPIASLIKLNLNAGIDFHTEIDIMLRVDLHGVTRQITRRLAVRVNATNRAVWHVAG